MGIKITTGQVVPTVAYERVHLMEMRILQPTFTDDLLAPKYFVEVIFRLYGVLDDVRHYEAQQRRVVIEDYLLAAMTDAAVGDMTLISALMGIEAAVSAIITDQAGYETVIV